MSDTFLAVLIAVAVTALATRLVFPAPPLRRFAARVSPLDTVLLGIGSAGLVFHCGAMFFRADVSRLPGTHGAIRAINAMGSSSRLWFIVPAILVVLGLRRQTPLAVAAVVAVLVAVGVTMYDHGPLATHLHAILAAVIVLSGVIALVVRPPWQHTPAPGTR